MDKPGAAGEGKGLKIIGAGFGRTGTLSLKVALEELGFSPCYHMIEVFERPADIAVWEAAALGKPIDWKALFAGYQATVDWPACIFYKELMQVYPDAKVLLTVRNPENWYESANSTIFQMRSRPSPISEQIRARMPDLQQFERMIDAIEPSVHVLMKLCDLVSQVMDLIEDNLFGRWSATEHRQYIKDGTDNVAG